MVSVVAGFFLETKANAGFIIAAKEVTNTTGDDADGYSMVVSCNPDDGRINVTQANLTVRTVPAGARVGGDFSGNNNSANVSIVWTVNISNDVAIIRSVLGDAPKSEVSSENFFTKTAALAPVPSVGWRVEANGDLFLENAYTNNVQFSNLYFQFPTAVDESNVVALLDTTPSGTNGFMTSGVVPASQGMSNGELYIARFDLAPNKFLTATMSLGFVNSSFSSITSTDAFGLQIPAPWLSLTVSNDQSLVSVQSVIAGKQYALQVSSDLSAWISTATNTAFTNTITFVDIAPAQAARFYRVQQQ